MSDVDDVVAAAMDEWATHRPETPIQSHRLCVEFTVAIPPTLDGGKRLAFVRLHIPTDRRGAATTLFRQLRYQVDRMASGEHDADEAFVTKAEQS